MGLSERPHLHSRLGGASFNPYSFVLSCDDLFEESVDEEVLDSIFRHFDRGSRIVNRTGQIEDSKTGSRIHELCHFYQFAGTTVGANLALVRYLRDSTGVANFSNLSADERRRLVARRAEGIPIIPLEEDYHLGSRGGFSEDFRWMSQIWYDYTLYDTVFCRGLPNDVLEHMVFLEQLIGEVNGDIISLLVEPEPDTADVGALAETAIEIKSRFRPADMGFYGDDDAPVATSHIFESQALVNELLFLRCALV